MEYVQLWKTKGKERVRPRNARTGFAYSLRYSNSDFRGYDTNTLIKETVKLGKIIKKVELNSNPVILHHYHIY